VCNRRHSVLSCLPGRAQEEGGDSLKPIDFDQLAIDNNKLLDTIEARNAQVLALKATCGAAQRQLNQVKESLLQTEQSSRWLLKTKNDKKTLLTESILKEAIQVKAIVEKENKLNKRLREGLETSNNVPSVLAYIAAVGEQKGLVDKIKRATTKVDITQGALRQLHAQHRRMYGTSASQASSLNNKGVAGGVRGSGRRFPEPAENEFQRAVVLGREFESFERPYSHGSEHEDHAYIGAQDIGGEGGFEGRGEARGEQGRDSDEEAGVDVQVHHIAPSTASSDGVQVLRAPEKVQE